MNLIDFMRDTATEYKGLKICIAPRRKLAKIFGVHQSKIWRGLKQLEKSGRIINMFSNGHPSIYVIKEK